MRAEAKAGHPLTAILNRLRAAAERAAEQDVCAICLEAPEDPVALPCAHSYCANCVAALRERRVHQLCPLCRSPLPLNGGDALYDAAARLFVPVQRAVERGRASWGRLPDALQADVDKSLALLKQASSSGHPEARACLGLGKRVLLAGLGDRTAGEDAAEYVDGDGGGVGSGGGATVAPRRRGAPAGVGSGDVGRRSWGGVELNGQVGVATAFDDSGNFVVTLKDGGGRVRVKPANIRMER